MFAALRSRRLYLTFYSVRQHYYRWRKGGPPAFQCCSTSMTTGMSMIFSGNFDRLSSSPQTKRLSIYACLIHCSQRHPAGWVQGRTASSQPGPFGTLSLVPWIASSSWGGVTLAGLVGPHNSLPSLGGVIGQSI
jgi:hypothetical protein